MIRADATLRLLPSMPKGRAIKLVLVVALLLIRAGGALAQTQMELTQKADDGWKAADAAMTKTWNATYAAMKQRDDQNTSRGGGFGFAGATLESQRAWLGFRDKQCVIEGGEFAGGSMQPMVQAQCLERLTKERTRQLKAMQWR